MCRMDQIKPNSTVAFVHAKGTSERLPGKNLRMLGGIPLVCHAIRNALAAKEVDHVVIDSDSDEILAVGELAGAIPLRRPGDLATNDTTGDDLAFWQASAAPQAMVIIQVVPTSPFIKPESISEAASRIKSSRLDSTVGMHSEHLYCWAFGKPTYDMALRLPNSQRLRPTVYETTGLYAFLQAYAIRTHRRMNIVNREAIWLSKIEAIDINTEEDFRFAEIVYKGMTSC